MSWQRKRQTENEREREKKIQSERRAEKLRGFLPPLIHLKIHFSFI